MTATAGNYAAGIGGSNGHLYSIHPHMGRKSGGDIDTILLSGNGKITAIAGAAGAAIGGGSRGSVKLIKISGGLTVNAIGGADASAIGGGNDEHYNFSDITLPSGGNSEKIYIQDSVKLYATGGEYGAAIGSGYAGTTGLISINLSSNGYLDVNGGARAAGIGGAKLRDSGTICISGDGEIAAKGDRKSVV